MTARTGPTVLPEPGNLVTVTLTDPTTGEQWNFHGRLSAERVDVLTVPDETNPHGYKHYSNSTAPAARPWTLIEHVIANQQYDLRTPYRGRDWQYQLLGLHVCVADDSMVTIAPITEAGMDWITATEQPWEKRDRLLARFADHDPHAAAELEQVIAEMIDEARDEGARSA